MSIINIVPLLLTSKMIDINRRSMLALSDYDSNRAVVTRSWKLLIYGLAVLAMDRAVPRMVPPFMDS
jgi:hypothetical protein